jgi:S1-C subfamily serine protease
MKRLLVAAMVLGWTLGFVRWARAQPTSIADDNQQPAIGFSNMIIRVDNDPSISIATDEVRIHILEALRQAGLNAVGAESLVFGKDHAQRADFLLGGTVRELRCLMTDELRCAIGIEWQVLDVKRDSVVYSVMTRFLTIGGAGRDPKFVGKTLVLGALRRLNVRPKFKAVLTKSSADARGEAPSYPKLGYKECEALPLDMPQAAEDALRATVVVRSNEGFGSGFIISPDGYILTAAHVVGSNGVSVHLRDGSIRGATVVRVAKNIDSALLRLSGSGPNPCLGAELGTKNVGDETYAIGSPASEKLAFSLTRGIISGVRNFDGVVFLQTDASVSPGNSGGPLINKQGRATAIVSWKIAGGMVQGLAFGIPIEVALRGLGVAPSAETDENLAQEVATSQPAVRVRAENDTADPPVSVDPSGDAERDNERRRAERDAKTPGYVFGLRWGGVTLACVSGLGALASAAAYEPSTTTRPEYDKYRLENTLSWVGVGLGSAMFISSYILRPSLPPAKAPAAAARIGFGVGPGQVLIGGGF